MMQEFVQEIRNTITRELTGIHTAMPGKILAFDPAKGLATVQPVMRFKKPDGSTMAFPQITGVPVVFPQGAGQKAVIAFPVKAGDGCLVVIAEQSLDYWLYGQETDTDLAFDMTNAICIPGMFQTTGSAVAAACAENAVVLEADGARITLKQGSVSIKASSVTIDGDLTVSGSIQSGGDMVAQGISATMHTHDCPQGGRTSPPQ